MDLIILRRGFWGVNYTILIKRNLQNSIANYLGVRTRGTLGDMDPLNKVPFKRARSRVQEGRL